VFSTVTRVAAVLQTLLTTRAEELARLTGLVRRQRKFSGASWVQTLVLGWMERPRATLEDLTEWAAQHGVRISPQGLDQWFCPEAAECLKQLAPLAVGALVQTQRAAVPLLQRFGGVYVEDCTTVPLPAALAAHYPGCGGNDPAGRDQAALKIYVRLEVTHGQLTELALQPGRQPDVCAGQQAVRLPAGALRLKDLGFFDTQVLAQDDQAGVQWISRLPCTVALGVGAAAPVALADWLAEQAQDRYDGPATVGTEQPVAGRLLALRCPEAVRQRRLRQLAQRARKKGRPVSRRQQVLCGWTVLFTNVPAERLSFAEAWVLYRTRWQIELLFKLWKSHGRLAQSLGKRDQRVLCEVLAKLLAALVQHWLLLLAGPWLGEVSAAQKVRVVRRYLERLAGVLEALDGLIAILVTLQRRLQRLRRRNRRQKKPSTLELLKEPQRAGLGLT